MMREPVRWFSLLLFAGALVVATRAHAIDEEFRYHTSQAWYKAMALACTTSVAGYNSGWSGTACVNNGGQWENGRLSGTSCLMDCRNSSGNLSGTQSPSVLKRTTTGDVNCPAAGSSKAVGHLYNNSFSAAGWGCVNGCEVEVDPADVSAVASGKSIAIGFGKATGRSCGATGVPHDEYVPEVLEDSPNSCQTNASGDLVCMEESTNCGLYNGDRICMDTVEDGECVSYASGGTACFVDTGGATAPPHPDDGTPGQPADPDMQLEGGGDTINYYNEETTNNSSGGAPAPGTNPDAPGQGPAPGGGGGGGGGGGSGTSVDVEIDFGEGSLPDTDLTTECDFNECTQEFFTRVQAAPLLASVSGVGAAVPSGSCPTYNLEAFAETFSLSEPMCDIWDTVSPLLSGVFLILWGWVATRIVLSA